MGETEIEIPCNTPRSICQHSSLPTLFSYRNREHRHEIRYFLPLLVASNVHSSIAHASRTSAAHLRKCVGYTGTLATDGQYGA
jgi:hypothetical protein